MCCRHFDVSVKSLILFLCGLWITCGCGLASDMSNWISRSSSCIISTTLFAVMDSKVRCDQAGGGNTDKQKHSHQSGGQHSSTGNPYQRDTATQSRSAPKDATSWTNDSGFISGNSQYEISIQHDDDEVAEKEKEPVHYVSDDQMMPYSRSGMILESEKDNMIIKNGSYKSNTDWVEVSLIVNSKNCYLAMDLTTKWNFIVKKLRREKCELNVLTEINKMPGVVKLLGYIIEENEIFAFLEFISGPNLSEYIQKNRLLPYEKKIIMKQILLTLDNLQLRNVIHNNIKGENFIFRQQMNKSNFSSCELILVGFSLATNHPSEPFDEDCLNKVPATHISPERAQKQSYSFPSDVFAAVIMFIQMFKDEIPRRHQNTEGILDQRKQGLVPTLSGFTEILKDFLSIGLDPDPDKRASAGSLLKHPFMVNDYKRASAGSLLKHPFMVNDCNLNLRENQENNQESSTNPTSECPIPDFDQLSCPVQVSDNNDLPAEDCQILPILDIPNYY